jgi:hypothetical protein
VTDSTTFISLKQAAVPVLLAFTLRFVYKISFRHSA